MKLRHKLFLKAVLICWGGSATAQEVSSASPAGLSQSPVVEMPPPPLRLFTNTHQIRQLSPEEASRGHPVRVRATVTGRGAFRSGYFVQDETGPIYVATTRSSEVLKPGQVLDIEGVTVSGRYAIQIKDAKRTVVGHGELPLPRRLTYEQLESGMEDCQYAEIEGVIRRTDVSVPRTPFRALVLAMGHGLVEVSVRSAETGNQGHLVDARVRLRGVISGRFNDKGRWAGARLFVSSLADMHIERPAPEQPFDMPLRRIHTLLQWDLSHTRGHRVKVRGVVTHFHPGETLYVRELQSGLLVQTRETQAVTPGDIVEVLGFPALGSYSSVLEDAVFRRVGRAPEPVPIEATPEQLLSGALDAGLVAVQGTLLESVRRRGERTLVVQADNVVFNAQVEQAAEDEQAEQFSPGSVLKLTGICAIQETTIDGVHLRPKSFSLLVRSPADIRILRSPSWWTPGRLLKTLALVSAAAVAGYGWVWLLRRRVRHQTQLIEHKIQREAVMEERTRIAQEFHDTLEQELTGVALQLEAAASQAGGLPVSRQLEVAHRLLQRSQAEVRSSVWDLRRPALEAGGLTVALKETALQLRNGSAVALRYEVEGEPRRLPALTEHHLLRIGVEAVTNALKHAHAGVIRVELVYQADALRLRVQDDGGGFAIAEARGCSQGHFGLVGMQERAEKIGAQFTVESLPGQGTRIEIRVPDVAGRSSSALDDATPERGQIPPEP